MACPIKQVNGIWTYLDFSGPDNVNVRPKIAVNLLDQAGQRMSVLNLENGDLLSQTEFPFPISSFALYLDENGSARLIYAARNAIYLPSQPELKVDIETTGQPVSISGRAPYDPQIWTQLPN
ncbi:MAG: hypothetical protein AAGD96_33640, partial [Chloroflexota bacterium]